MPASRRRLIVLGATGTVGRQALAVLARAASPVEVVGLSAHADGAGLAELARELPGCSLFLTSAPEQKARLLAFLRAGEGYDLCLNAVVGAAGLAYSEAVLAAGRDLALANKESLVLAGALLAELAERTGGRLIPVDSEHCAIQQCLNGASRPEVRRLFLTASGGALRDLPLAELAEVRPEQALAHPNWDMGPRITIDSATMMNKALEVLEAQVLFGVAASSIEVLIHRQSVVHSFVEFVDGSVLAQMGPPDMAFPIHWALHAPGRQPAPLRGFDPALFAELTFSAPDPERYPSLALGYRAAEAGGAAGAVLNAADEVAVEAFLAGGLAFPAIAEICAEVLDRLSGLPASSLDEIRAADRAARDLAGSLVAARTP
ncbi:MAG: 1-deoxy-D-xylulose-5-phosphate reductoisomerase [Planctomycetota bacterium]|nr:MAG: 1-deoxy-D-xylulose-5-phosphate reductoisomerase [Planctomycetota bacterium]